jgi:hypothetical protein
MPKKEKFLFRNSDEFWNGKNVKRGDHLLIWSTVRAFAWRYHIQERKFEIRVAGVAAGDRKMQLLEIRLDSWGLTVNFSSLKTEGELFSRPSSYCAVKKFHLGCKNQSVYITKRVGKIAKGNY